jgi:hypothetical protein
VTKKKGAIISIICVAVAIVALIATIIFAKQNNREPINVPSENNQSEVTVRDINSPPPSESSEVIKEKEKKLDLNTTGKEDKENAEKMLVEEK